MQHFKLTIPKLALLLAAAAAAAPEAGAAVLNYAAGDLLLGFRKAGAANDYIVNLGPSTQFTTGSGIPFVLNVGDLGADLSSASLFGSGWASDPTVSWSVSGAIGVSSANGEPPRTLFATKGENVFGVLENPWTTASATTQSAPGGKIGGMGNVMIGQNSTANSDFALIQPVGALSSYASFHDAADSYDYFPGNIEGEFGAGLEALDLFRLRPVGTGGSAGPGEYLGRFTIDPSGNLTFTPVPEPAGISLVCAVATGLLLRRRRAIH